MTTLLDIAKKLNLSVSTISRALSNPEKISKQTRELIIKTAKEMNYVGNISASNLRKGKSNFIGLVISDLSDPLMSVAAMTMQEYAIKKGYFPIVISSDESVAKEASILQKLTNLNIAGLVICPTCKAKENIQNYAPNIPIVELDRSTYSFLHDEFRMDDRAAMKISTDYLIKKGHKNIAVIAGDCSLVFSFKERCDALRYCSENAKYQLFEISNVSQKGLRQGTFEYLDEIFENKFDFTAIICCNAAIAMGTIMAIHKHKLNIGKNIDMLCMDHTEWIDTLPYTITTLQHPLEKAALEAVRRLIHRIEQTCSVPDPEVRLFVPRICYNFE